MIAVSLASVIALAGCSKDASQQEAAETAYKSITTEEVSENAGAEGWVIVDTRLNDAFNGWALDGVARGGHIEGAVDFSANWLLTEKEGKEERGFASDIFFIIQSQLAACSGNSPVCLNPVGFI